jgi:hypothetical protein
MSDLLKSIHEAPARKQRGKRKASTYTLDREIKAQLEFFRRAKEACLWLEKVLNEKIITNYDADVLEANIQKSLQDGTYLCKLISEIVPGTIPKYHSHPKIPFLMMENIEKFRQACLELGMKRELVFEVIDLLENKSASRVVACIHGIASIAAERSFRHKIVRKDEKQDINPQKETSNGNHAPESNQNEDKEIGENVGKYKQKDLQHFKKVYEHVIRGDKGKIFLSITLEFD